MFIRILIATCFMGLASSVLGAGLEGSPAPTTPVASPEGVERSIAEVAQGRRAVIVFWASWCPFCKTVMTDLVAERKALGDNVALIAINIWDEDDDSDMTAEAVLEARGLSDFESQRGDDADAKAWGVKGTPGLFVLDVEGVVVWDASAHPFEQPKESDRRAAIANVSKQWIKGIQAALATAKP